MRVCPGDGGVRGRRAAVDGGDDAVHAREAPAPRPASGGELSTGQGHNRCPRLVRLNLAFEVRRLHALTQPEGLADSSKATVGSTCRRLHQVALVCVGICLRGAAFGSSASGAKGSGKGAAADGQLWGLAAMLTSALGYSLLGVLYDLLLSTESPPPAHAEVMQYTSKLGALLEQPSFRCTKPVHEPRARTQPFGRMQDDDPFTARTSRLLGMCNHGVVHPVCIALAWRVGCVCCVAGRPSAHIGSRELGDVLDVQICDATWQQHILGQCTGRTSAPHGIPQRRAGPGAASVAATAEPPAPRERTGRRRCSPSARRRQGRT